MTTHLIFIRHAQSTWNELRRWQGHSDTPLSETGRSQARLLARRLADWPIDHLYTSDLLRAAETAAFVGESLGIRPVADPAWRERGFGAAEGLTSEEIETGFPEAWASRNHGPMIGVPGSEPPEEVIARAQAGIAGLLANHVGQTVAVVSHAGMILTALVQLLGLPPWGYRLLNVGSNTAISRVTVENGYSRLIGLNDAAHLELLQQPEPASALSTSTA